MTHPTDEQSREAFEAWEREQPIPPTRFLTWTAAVAWASTSDAALREKIAELGKQITDSKRCEHQTFMDAAKINKENDALRAQVATLIKERDAQTKAKDDKMYERISRARRAYFND